jgi:hypothetical protein
MVADPFFLIKIDRLKATVRRYIGGFCYDSASNSPTVAIRAMVGATVGISRPSYHDMPRDFARYATAGRFCRILL